MRRSDAHILAIKEFKRNKELQAVHVVQGKVFSKIEKATAYKRAIFAKHVISILRDEVSADLQESPATPKNTSTEENNKDDQP